jgi:hypothetical protein
VDETGATERGSVIFRRKIEYRREAPVAAGSMMVDVALNVLFPPLAETNIRFRPMDKDF